MEKDVKNILILGVAGFPSGGARIEKLKLIGKALKLQGCKVHIISNSWGRYKKGQLDNKGEVEGLTYHYSCKSTHRPGSFLSRRLIKLYGQINEIRYLLFNNCDVAIVSFGAGKFFQLLKYWILKKIRGFKIFYPYHEDENNLLINKTLFSSLNVFLFKKYAWKMLDGAFPISSYLEKKILKRNPNLPLLRIPAFVDFEIFDKIKLNNSNTTDKYFLFCGSLGYYKTIDFIIKSFEILLDKEFQLHLICSGTQKQKNQLINRINQSNKKSLIKIFDFLPYNTLVNKYLKAKALLIPLNNSTKDIARFPHKLGEYAASGNPIITNPFGDVTEYFKNHESAIFANKFSTYEYAKKMNFVINNPEKARRIGEKGYKAGLTFFNYKQYSESIFNFINSK